MVVSRSYFSLSNQGNIVSATNPKILTLFKAGWFLVELLMTLSFDSTYNNNKFDNNGDNNKNNYKIVQMLITKKISFRSYEMVQTGCYEMYLNKEQVDYLVEMKIANLYPINKENKVKSAMLLNDNNNISKNNIDKHLNDFLNFEEGSNCFVYSVPNWETNDFEIIGRISESLYIVENCESINLYADPQVLRVTKLPEYNFLNRYSSGLLQSGQEQVSFSQDYIKIDTPLSNRGIDGTNEIIQITDSGLDMLHPFFYDPAHPDIPINITDKTHRKVVRYDASVDSFDSKDGHGTHVSGTAAGNPLCIRCGIKMYKGVAPGSKIYFYDVGISTDGNNNFTSNFNYQEITKNMREMGSYISSNSWGSSSYHPVQTAAFDKLAYNNQDILFIFAAGNDGKGVYGQTKYFSINSPSDSKNVLSIGNLGSPKGRFIEDEVLRIYNLIGDGNPDKSYQVEFTTRGINPFDEEIKGNFKWITNQKIVSYSSTIDLKDKIVILPLNSTDQCNIREDSLKKGCTGFVVLRRFKFCSAIDEEAYSKKAYHMIVNDVDYGGLIKHSEVTLKLESRNENILDIDESSSRGETLYGTSKPDLVATGTDIISASAGDPKNTVPLLSKMIVLSKKSGTSMSAPAVAGAAALIRQYFIEGWFPKNTKGSGNPIYPSATLLTAVLVNSVGSLGKGSAPEIAIGYGLPNLEQGLGFIPENGHNILRIVQDKQITSKSHHVYKFNAQVDSEINLKATMAYSDPPLPHSSAYRYYADLDLYLETPDGKTLYGNENAQKDGDSFSTIEKVLISGRTMKAGEYKIHIISSDYASDEIVKYSLAINGYLTSELSFNDNDSTCPESCKGNGQCVDGQCVCNKDKAGISCGLLCKKISTSVNPPENSILTKDIRYFYFEPSFVINRTLPLNVSMILFAIQGLPTICYSIDKRGKIAGKNWKCTNERNFLISEEMTFKNTVYFAVFCPIPLTSGTARIIIDLDQVYVPIIPKPGPDPEKSPVNPNPDPIQKPGPDTEKSPVNPSPNPSPNPADSIVSSSKNNSESDKEANLKKKQTNNTAVIAGSVVGAVIGIAIITGAVILFVKHKKFIKVGAEISP